MASDRAILIGRFKVLSASMESITKDLEQVRDIFQDPSTYELGSIIQEYKDLNKKLRDYLGDLPGTSQKD